MPLTAGYRLGVYEIVAPLGVGGMGRSDLLGRGAHTALRRADRAGLHRRQPPVAGGTGWARFLLLVGAGIGQAPPLDVIVNCKMTAGCR